MFRIEREMVPAAQRWLESLGLQVKPEFATPWGVCDLVGASLDQKRVRMRLALGQRKAIGPPLRIALLCKIPDISTGHGISRKSLAKPLSWLLDSAAVGDVVDRLVADNFVRLTSRGMLQKVNGWMPLHKHIVAVELKLNRVSEALCQARNHLAFATECYVGLPLPLAREVAFSGDSARFASIGVGLLGISPTSCDVILRPVRKKPSFDPVIQIHCAERFWRTAVTAQGL